MTTSCGHVVSLNAEPVLRHTTASKQHAAAPGCAHVAAGGSCTDHPLPSGSEKKQKRPHGYSWTSVTSTPRPNEESAGLVDVFDDELRSLQRSGCGVNPSLANCHAAD